MLDRPFEDVVVVQRELLAELGVGSGACGLVLDLGSGPGMQSLALAELGFARVLAVAEHVCQLIDGVANLLAPGGQFVVTFRDLTTPLAGDERFLLVRADDDAILTCFLEYTDPQTVRVHDLVHRRDPNLGWTLAASSYPKLRLDPQWVAGWIRAAGLQISRNEATAQRMWLLNARRPPPR